MVERKKQEGAGRERGREGKNKQKQNIKERTEEEEEERREYDQFAEEELKGKKHKQKNRLKKDGKEKMVEQEEEKTEDGGKDEEKAVLKMGREKHKQMTHASSTRSMFADGFAERHDLEQYFWSEKTVLQLTQALQSTMWHSEHGHVCCLAAPSLAHAFYATQGRAEALLDIDTRFEYLPGFRFFDLCNPASSDSDDFRIVVFDPPFFYIPLPVLFQAVLVAVHGNLQAKLLVGFLRREEGSFLQMFAPFCLRRTRFVLEYATVKPNKWRNYALYANIDLPGIKRIA